MSDRNLNFRCRSISKHKAINQKKKTTPLGKTFNIFDKLKISRQPYINIPITGPRGAIA